MIECLTLSKLECALIFGALIMLFFYHMKSGYGVKKALFWSIVFLPVLYFSVNMVTEAVTADEPGYEQCITDVRNIKNQSKAEAVLYEYKLAQLTKGTVFLLIPTKIKDILGENGIWKLYKVIHWLIIYLICILTTNVWRKWILVDKDERKNRISENAILAALMGLPLSCLLIKVTNYDAGSTYTAILGVSMVWAAYRQHDEKMAFGGTMVTALGPMEKWTALPYWAISVVLFVLVVIDEESTFATKMKKSVKAIAISFGGVIALSSLYFVYAYFQQGGFYRTIDLGVVSFSFTHAARAVITRNWYVNSSNSDIIFFVPLALVIMICVVILDFLRGNICKSKEKTARIYLISDIILIITGFIGGVIATYFIPLKIAPYLPIEEGYYVSTDFFDGWTYHFGAKTAVGHFLCKLCYMSATIVVNYPVVVLFLLLLVMIALKKNDEKSYFCSLILSASLVLLLLYTVAGLPYDAKYYSYPIIIIMCVFIYLVYQYVEFTNLQRAIMYVGMGLYCIEMLMFVPNMKSFSPIWLWRSAEWNESIRMGEWYAGEVMFWGEELAIAGKKISALIDESEDISDVNIYTNYGRYWLGNPGYELKNIYDYDLEFSENDYYVLSKFRLFRKGQPPFIKKVEPVASISYKGEIGAWIYKGEDLREYTDYFVEETGKNVLFDGE